MLSKFWTVIQAIAAFPLIVKYLQELDRLIKKKELEQWGKELGDTLDSIKKSESEDDKVNSLSRLNSLISKLRIDK